MANSVIQTPVGAVRELVTHRTEHAKLFEMPENRRKLVVAGRRVHVARDVETYKIGGYPDWDDVDTDLERLPEGYCIKSGWYTCCVEPDRIAYQYESKLSGRVEVVLTHIGGTPVASLPLFFDPQLTANCVVFPSLLPDLDLEFICRAEGLYLNKILRSAGPPRVFEWAIEKSADCPLIVNTATSGMDNYGALDKSRQGTGKGNICRKLEMVHEVEEAKPERLATRTIFRERWTGRTFIYDAERRLQPRADAIYPVWIDQDITQPVTATIDDGYGITTGGFYNAFVQNFFGYYMTDSYYPFQRFLALNIPQGSTIVLAELKVEMLGLYGAGNTMTIYGYDVDSAGQFTAINQPGTVPRTAATTTAVLTVVGPKTFDVTAIVQEIVNRAGWAPGSNIGLMMLAPATTGVGAGGYIEDYSNAGTNEPVLEVTFDPPAVANIIPRTTPSAWMRNAG